MTPGLARRLGSLVYEGLTFLAIAFFAGTVFFLATGGQKLSGGLLGALQWSLVFLMWSFYTVYSWLRGGQTLAMRAWRIRLVDLTPPKALLRLALATVLLPTGLSLVWALFDRDRQFLHDRLARTRLVVRPPADKRIKQA